MSVRRVKGMVAFTLVPPPEFLHFAPVDKWVWLCVQFVIFLIEDLQNNKQTNKQNKTKNKNFTSKQTVSYK